jgi:hypothetical protein
LCRLNIHASTDGGDILLEGDIESFRNISEVLESSATQASFELTEPGKLLLRSGLTYLPELRIICSEGLVNIAVDSKEMVISGGKGNLQRLAQNFRFFIKHAFPHPPGSTYHVHIEYYSDHPFLAESAVPLILVAEESPT